MLVQKAEPKEVQARLAGHTPAMNGLARMVEDGLVHPAEVVSEAGGPNDGPNPGGPEVELGGRSRDRGAGRGPMGLWCVETGPFNIVVYRAQKIVTRRVGPD